MPRSFDDDHALVTAFTTRFALLQRETPGWQDEEWLRFRLARLQEEIDEIEQALAKRDLPGVADGLIDLHYIGHGTAIGLGVPWRALFDEVHRANMTKERAVFAAQSKHRTTHDIIKPRGWVGPDVEGVLRAHGWDGR